MTDMSNYQQIVAVSRYSRWDEENQRREMWPETVARMVNFWKERCDLTDDRGQGAAGRNDEPRGDVLDARAVDSRQGARAGRGCHL